MIVAHRGASHAAPENTLEAFELAIGEGAEGVEMDVRIAADGVPVVFHDATLKRIAGSDERVSSLTSRALSGVSVGRWFNGKYPERARDEFAAATVPTLEEVLGRLGTYGGTIYIELKCDETEIGQLTVSVASLLSSSPLRNQVIVKSFDPDVIPRLRASCPDVRTAALFAPKVMSLLRKEKRLVNIAVDLDADVLSLHSSLVTKKLMKKARKAGLEVTLWTVNNSHWVRRSIELGVGTIITDRPAKMLLKRRQLLHRNSIIA